MRQLLDSQADQIELVLYSHNITGQVQGGVVTPRWTRFTVALPATVKPEKVRGLESAIAHRLGCTCRVITKDGPVIVEVARLSSARVTLSQLSLQLDRPPALSAVLGIGLDDGQPLLLNLPSPDVAHVLVAGTTGSGKTTLMQAMLASLAWYNDADVIKFYILDPKHRYDDLGWLPHLPLHSITHDVADQLDVLAMLVSEMEQRQSPEPRLLCVIDELADLAMVGGDDVILLLTRLTQRGREVGIHVIAGAQKPTTEAIGSLVKSNFPTRIVGKVTSAEDAKTASGLPRTGAETLRGHGDFLLCLGDLIRFQAAMPDKTFIHRLRGKIRRSGYLGDSDGDPLKEYRKRVKGSLRVLPGGLQDEREARRIINKPGWIAEWWDGYQLKYAHQSEIGRLIGEKNAGGGRDRILRVAQFITEILRSSTDSTTSTGKP